jgi:hypothetical protein
MAYGDGIKNRPNDYVETTCPSCGKTRLARKPLVPGRKCKSCAMKKPNPHKGTGIKNDPTKLGSYNSYNKARRRCSESDHYKEYGIEFLFNNFEEWWKELGERPEGHTVDRIDPMGNYEPGNVRWATMKEQSNNRNPRRWAKRPSEE